MNGLELIWIEQIFKKEIKKTNKQIDKFETLTKFLLHSYNILLYKITCSKGYGKGFNKKKKKTHYPTDYYCNELHGRTNLKDFFLFNHFSVELV